MTRLFRALSAAAVFCATAMVARATSFTVVLANNTSTPMAAPITLSGGVFYGVTYQGKFFSVDTNGNYTSLLTNNGGSFYSGLTEANGNLYGIMGGTYGGGSLFSLNTASPTNLTIISSSLSGQDGEQPVSGPVVTADLIYGASGLGNSITGGAIFGVNTNGSNFLNLHVFPAATNDGIYPNGVVLAGNTLFGTTLEGGAENSAGGSYNYGVLFSVDTDGSNYSVLHYFDSSNTLDTDGTGPAAGLTLSGDVLYGTTAAGGASNQGTVFSIHTDGTHYTILHSFGGPDGADPQSSLVISNTTLYGTTAAGGTNGSGVVFQMGTDGAGYIDLHSFGVYNPYFASTRTNADGAAPMAPPVLLDGYLYGTTSAAGPNGGGTFYSISLPGASGGGGGGSNLLTVTTNGSGGITISPNPAKLKSGEKVTATAKPAAGWLFENWTGSVNTNKNPVTFAVAGGDTLTANFVTNPFLALAATYDGLFYAAVHQFQAAHNFQSGLISLGSSGMLKSLVVTAKGTYSGTLVLNGSSYPVSGVFDPASQTATETVKVSAANGKTVTLSLTVTNNPEQEITGTVTLAAATATLTAFPGATSGAAGQYTVLIPANTNYPSAPGGTSYALVSTTAGSAKKPATAVVTGLLADGTAFSDSTILASGGLIPVYAKLYGGKGELLAWLSVGTTNTADDFAAWVANAHTAKAYAAGFNTIIDGNSLQSGAWTNSPSNFDTLTNLVLPTATASVTITATGKLSGPNEVGSVNPKTGAFAITVGKGLEKIQTAGAIIAGSTNGGAGYVIESGISLPVQLLP